VLLTPLAVAMAPGMVTTKKIPGRGILGHEAKRRTEGGLEH